MAFKFCVRRKWLAAKHVAEVGILQFQTVRSTPLNKIAGEIEIPGVAGGAIKLNESHLQFRMAGNKGPLCGAEIVDQVIGEPDSRVEQTAVSGGAVVRDARLNQMTEAITFV